MFCAYGAMLGVISYLSFYFQDALGDSALISGLKTMPRSFGFILGAVIAGKNMDRFFRPILASGGLIVGVASGLFGLLTVNTSYGWIALFFALQGLGMGMQMPCTTVLVQNSVSRSDVGTAMSGFSFVGTIGGALFVAIYGGVYNHRVADQLGGLSPHNPKTIAEYEHKAPGAITNAVALVCLCCIAPAGVSCFLALFIRDFDVKGAASKGSATAPAPASRSTGTEERTDAAERGI